MSSRCAGKWNEGFRICLARRAHFTPLVFFCLGRFGFRSAKKNKCIDPSTRVRREATHASLRMTVLLFECLYASVNGLLHPPV